MAIFLPNSHFGTFFSVHQFQNFFLPDDFSLSIMKDLLHTFSKKVSLALSRPVHVLIREDKLNFPHRISKILFVFSSWDDFGSLGCRIGECSFFYVHIMFISRQCVLRAFFLKIGFIANDMWFSNL